MASITNQANGRRVIQFVGSDGKRRSIRLGKVSQRVAEGVKYRIEAINAAKIAGHTLDADTASWIAGLDDEMHAKLANAGLVPARASQTLKAFLDQYLAHRADVKQSTKIHIGQTVRNLIAFFGADKPLHTINEQDANAWNQFLIEDEKLSPNTVRRRCGIAKQLFKVALKRKLVKANPFVELKASVRGNSKKFAFITNDQAASILEACPDAEWRLIFALSRYGGLRCPSEHLLLKWADIDWERKRIRISSPKTEHHEGGECRYIPMFPELVQPLNDVWDQAKEGQEYVITRYRSAKQICGRSLARSSSVPDLSPGRSSFKTCDRPGRPNLLSHFRCMLSVAGSAILAPWLPSTTCR